MNAVNPFFHGHLHPGLLLYDLGNIAVGFFLAGFLLSGIEGDIRAFIGSGRGGRRRVLIERADADGASAEPAREEKHAEKFLC